MLVQLTWESLGHLDHIIKVPGLLTPNIRVNTRLCYTVYLHFYLP